MLQEEGEKMAFFRRKRTFSVLIVILVLIIICVLSGGFYYLYKTRLDEIIEKYEKEIELLNFNLYSLKRQVYIPIKDIPFGTVISQDLFNVTEMKLDIPQKSLIDKSDMGKVNTVFLPAGMPVLKISVADEKLANDIREQEFSMFLIQTDQRKGDFIDVRIMFPNGENYIVLSKKQIKDLILEDNTIRLWLNESEIHNISSAIIDAYIHQGTKIYVTTYIMPELQEAAIPFYAPNEEVLNLMRRDPNIIEKVSDALAREIRAILERNLNSITEENLNKVTTGISDEISKNIEIIQSQESRQDKTGESNSENQNIAPEDNELFN